MGSRCVDLVVGDMVVEFEILAHGLNPIKILKSNDLGLRIFRIKKCKVLKPQIQINPLQ